MRSRIVIVGAVVAAASLSLVPRADAASIVCPVGIGFNQPIWDNVTPNTGPSGCELGGFSNDQPGPGRVNSDTMFDISTWQELLEEDVNTASGNLSWSANLFDGKIVGSLMIVLKGPNENSPASPGVYVGYKLAIGTTSVDFTSPFVNTNSGNAMDVSHFTLYWAEGRNTTQVPEPALLALMGSGLFAVAAYRRRR